MTTQHAHQLEEFVAALDDADAWNTLARLGWRLVDRSGGEETWERDGLTVRREIGAVRVIPHTEMPARPRRVS